MYIESVFHTPDEVELASSLYLTWAGHRICKPDHSIGPRVLPNYKMVLVVEGSGFFRLNDQDRLIRAGDLFFCFPNVIHHYFANTSDPWTIKWFSFNGNRCAQIMRSLGVTPDEPIFADCMTVKLLSYVDEIIAGLKRDNEHTYAATGYSYLIFDELLSIRNNEGLASEKEIAENELLEKIKRFVRLNYANTLSVDVVAAHLNYSRSFISHFFKQHAGMSLPQFVNEFRIRRACELLSQMDMNNEEIAMSVGYDDALYFIKVFKRYMQITPQKYRQRMQDEAQRRTNE